MITVALDWLLDEVRDRLGAGLFEDRSPDGSLAAASLVMRDRIAFPASAGGGYAHRAVSANFIREVNQNALRDRDRARAVVEIEVVSAYRVRPGNQQDSEREALRIVEQIRAWLTSLDWLRALHPTYTGLAHSHVPEWLLYRQVFQFTRHARLGG